ncbi:hypothetical protein HDU76_010636, partial [Blyttiomyces sp. JEL0837]
MSAQGKSGESVEVNPKFSLRVNRSCHNIILQSREGHSPDGSIWIKKSSEEKASFVNRDHTRDTDQRRRYGGGFSSLRLFCGLDPACPGEAIPQHMVDLCGDFAFASSKYGCLEALLRSLVRMAGELKKTPRLEQLYRIFLPVVLSSYLAFRNADPEGGLIRFGKETFVAVTVTVHAMESPKSVSKKAEEAALATNVNSVVKTEAAIRKILQELEAPCYFFGDSEVEALKGAISLPFATASHIALLAWGVLQKIAKVHPLLQPPATLTTLR